MFVAMRAMFGVADGLERKHVVDRLQRGKRDRVERGAQPGSTNPKFGFRYLDDFKSTKDAPGRTTYAIEETSAAIVRDIFNWKTEQGKSARWIARQLNLLHQPTPATQAQLLGHGRLTGDEWHHNMVRRILQDRAYIGEMEVFRTHKNKQHVKNGDGIMEKKTVRRDTAADARMSVPCPAIISVEQWERAQQPTVKEGHPVTIAPEDAVMRGHVWCKCGRRMRMYRNERGTYVYVCSARTGDSTSLKHVCPFGNQSIRAHIVNAEGIEAARNIALRRGLLREFLNKEVHEDEALRRVTDGLVALVERKTAERDNYFGGIGGAQNATVRQRLLELADKCSQEIEDAQVKIAENRKQLDSIDQQHASFEHTVRKLETYDPEVVATLPVEEKRSLLDLIGLVATVGPRRPKELVKVGGRLEKMYRDQDGTLHSHERLDFTYKLQGTVETCGTVQMTRVKAPIMSMRCF
jgi:hypothetical protein